MQTIMFGLSDMQTIVFGLAYVLGAIWFLVEGRVGPGLGFIVVGMLWFVRYGVRRRRARLEMNK
jgi:hypothetical protein